MLLLFAGRAPTLERMTAILMLFGPQLVSAFASLTDDEWLLSNTVTGTASEFEFEMVFIERVASGCLSFNIEL